MIRELIWLLVLGFGGLAFAFAGFYRFVISPLPVETQPVALTGILIIVVCFCVPVGFWIYRRVSIFFGGSDAN